MVGLSPEGAEAELTKALAAHSMRYDAIRNALNIGIDVDIIPAIEWMVAENKRRRAIKTTYKGTALDRAKSLEPLTDEEIREWEQGGPGAASEYFMGRVLATIHALKAENERLKESLSERHTNAC